MVEVGIYIRSDNKGSQLKAFSVRILRGSQVYLMSLTSRSFDLDGFFSKLLACP